MAGKTSNKINFLLIIDTGRELVTIYLYLTLEVTHDLPNSFFFMLAGCSSWVR